MRDGQDTLSASLRGWDTRISAFRLPDWKELPDIELYMDQVITFLSQQLGPYLHDKPITASVINNYVRTGVIPAPKKKRYARLHLAFLAAVFTLRQSMSIADISKIIPASTPAEKFELFYTQYVKQQRETTQLFVTHLRPLIAPPAGGGTSEMNRLIASSALVGSLSRILTEHLLTEYDSMQTAGEEEGGGQKEGDAI